MRIEPIDLSEARAAMIPKPQVRASAYGAARMDRTTYDWAFKILSVDQEIGLDQEKIVGRSRELARDDATMSKFLATVWKNVFGPDGIRLQSKVGMQRGGKPNKMVNDIIQAAWLDWGKKQNCTLDRRLSWIQLQRVIARTVPTDGECFLRKVFTDSNPYGFALKIINADCVSRGYGTNSPLILPNGNRIFMGVETNPNGAVEAYYVFTRHPSESGMGPREMVRIPAEEMLHIFLPIRDNQTRGIPWAAPAMFRMNMLKGYIEAETVAARVAACQMGFIIKDIDPNAGYAGPSPDSAGGMEIPVEAGAFGALAPGERIEQFKPEHPTTAFESFVTGSKMDIAAGLDVAYMTLSGDVGAANYSSARVGLLDERDTWEGLQGFFIEELCQPVFSEWVRMAFLRLGLAGYDWRAYDKPEWHPRSFPWIDPEKEAQAEILKLQHGFTTMHRILGSQGYDFEETMEERKQELEQLKQMGMGDLAAAYVPVEVTKAAAPTAAEAGHPKPKPLARQLTDLVMLADKGK